MSPLMVCEGQTTVGQRICAYPASYYRNFLGAFLTAPSPSTGSLFKPCRFKHRCKFERVRAGICTFSETKTSFKENLVCRLNSQITCSSAGVKTVERGLTGPLFLSVTRPACFQYMTVLGLSENRSLNSAIVSEESCISFRTLAVVLALAWCILPINQPPEGYYNINQKIVGLNSYQILQPLGILKLCRGLCLIKARKLNIFGTEPPQVTQCNKSSRKAMTSPANPS